MAKKSNRKRSLSEASRHQSHHSEQTQSPPQHTKSPLHSPKTQITSSVETQGDNTLSDLIQSRELSPEVRSAHNNALLELLDPRPQCLASKFQQGDEGRTLSIRKERELATNLAFLAGISDSSHHIMGVCIEERPDIGGCQVMVSINKCLPSDGSQVLSKVQKGFEQIFKRLSVLSASKMHVIAREAH